MLTREHGSETAAPTDAHDGRIRVLHFISDSYPTEYFRLIARHTDHERFEMTVASLRASGGLQAGLDQIGVPTFALGAEKRSQYPLTDLRLAAWLRRNRIDVLHAHLFEASVVGLLAARAAGVPVRVFTGHHSHEVPLHQRRSLLEVDRFVARRLANVIVAPSREMGATFVNLYGCDAHNVEVIEHGVDLTRFDPAHVDGHAVRAELGLSDRLVFTAVSKHFWVKNLDALVFAFAEIADLRPDAHLLILGIGDSSPLSDLVGRLGLSERVTVLARRDDVPAVLAATDIFVHPALAESFGFAVVEAMAMQKPVIVRPVGIAGDVVEDGVSGFLIAGTDAASIRGAMLRAVDAAAAWPAIGAEARHRVLHFTPERWVRAHEELYARRLARSGA